VIDWKRTTDPVVVGVILAIEQTGEDETLLRLGRPDTTGTFIPYGFSVRYRPDKTMPDVGELSVGVSIVLSLNLDKVDIALSSSMVIYEATRALPLKEEIQLFKDSEWLAVRYWPNRKEVPDKRIEI